MNNSDNNEINNDDDARSLKALLVLKPPLSCVVINSTHESAQQNGGGFFTSPSPASARRPAAEIQKSSSPPNNYSNAFGSSSFKLMPRNNKPMLVATCTPSPSQRGTGTRGLKRNAVSMSNTAFHQRSPGSNSLASPKETIDASNEAGSLFKLQQLSLQSPVTQKSTSSDDTRSPLICSNTADVNRTRPSSFSVYSASPSGSINRTNGSLSGFEMPITRTPSSSTKSSPRQVPLTVLSRTFTSPAATRNPGRPPIPMSSMLHSLDAQEDSPNSYNRRMVEEVLMHTPRGRCGSDVETIGISPRTPLPKVTLTPRTPLSSLSSRRRNQPRQFPNFPSPPNDGISTTPHSRQNDEMSNLMDSLLDGFPQHQRVDVSSSNSTGFRAFSKGHAASSFNSLELSQDGSSKVSPVRRQEGSLESLKSEFSLDHDETNNKGTKSEAPGFLPLPEITVDQKGTPLRQNRRVKRDVTDDDEDDDDIIPAVQSRSLLRNNLVNGRNLLCDIMRAEARVGVVDAENCSLSDSDDDHEFVLTSPKSRLEGSSEFFIHHRGTKQRKKCSFDNFLLLGNSRPSMNSLALSHASNTSLLGMDIVHDNGPSSCSRTTTPFSKSSSGTLRSIDGQGGLKRLKSDHSLGSLGLSLDDTAVLAERDLVTPPITDQTKRSSPPLMLVNNGANGTIFVE